MLVDDEESVRLSIGKYLYNAGYNVTACADDEVYCWSSSRQPAPGSFAAVAEVRRISGDAMDAVSDMRYVLLL